MIWLVRHGETAGNLSKKRYLDLAESEMIVTQKGRADLERLRAAGHIGDRPIGHTATAPERRCRESLELLTGSRDYAVDRRIRAQDWGPLDFPGARELLASTNKWPSGLDARFTGGESAREVRERCQPVCDELLAREIATPEALHVVVTHGVVIRMLLSVWWGWSDAATDDTPSIATASGVALAVSPDENALVEVPG